METALFILGILVLGLVVNIALRQSYNFIFFVARKPTLWIVFVAVLAVAIWYLAAKIGWSVSVPMWGSLIGLLFNLPLGQSKDVAEAADEIYADMGMKRGRLLYRIGLATFALAGAASWLVFYGQICTASGECRPLL